MGKLILRRSLSKLQDGTLRCQTQVYLIPTRPMVLIIVPQSLPYEHRKRNKWFGPFQGLLWDPDALQRFEFSIFSHRLILSAYGMPPSALQEKRKKRHGLCAQEIHHLNYIWPYWHIHTYIHTDILVHIQITYVHRLLHTHYAISASDISLYSPHKPCVVDSTVSIL